MTWHDVTMPYDFGLTRRLNSLGSSYFGRYKGLTQSIRFSGEDVSQVKSHLVLMKI